MTVEFYLFRHGQTDWNKMMKVQGVTDIPLNSSGREEALGLREFFKDIELDIVYSSDLKRAHETAMIAFYDRDIEIVPTSSLREANFGAAEGLHIDELLAKYPFKFWDILKGGVEADNYSYPGGETRREFRERLISFIDQIKTEKKNSRIGLSIHGGVLRSIIHHYLPEAKELIKIPNCVVYKLTFKGEDLVVDGPLNGEIDLCYSK